jgi:outer membrane protein
MEKNNQKLYIISGIFAVALIVLYILHFTARPSDNQITRVVAPGDSIVALPIAFVNIDSLLLNYHFAQDLNEKLMTQEESIRATLTQRERNIAAAITEFNRRIETNAFMGDRAQQEANRIQRMEQDAQQLAQRLMGEFQMEQMHLNMRMEDTIQVRINQFNAVRGFDVIFGNVGSSTILYANQKYDITQELIDFLNSSYDYDTYWAK